MEWKSLFRLVGGCVFEGKLVLKFSTLGHGWRGTPERLRVALVRLGTSGTMTSGNK